jgi:hypothetical protein
VKTGGTAALVSHEGLPVGRFVLEGEEAAPFLEHAWLSPSYGVRHPGRCFGWRWARAEIPWNASVRVSDAAGILELIEADACVDRGE